MNITYFKQYPRHTLVADTIIIPDEFTEGAVLYAVGKGLVRKKMSPMEGWGAAQKAADRIS
ncbi:MAG: hypothetical protein JRE40_11040 [Deltaproteobacteria bacterium]|nr:hypothetical protein [Deltaproteobacteria bacterium]